MRNNEKTKVLFINGVGHSGSTLLDVLLNNHSEIFGVGELEKFGHKVIHPDSVCACGKDFIDCNFWSDFVREHKSFLDKGVRQINKTKKDILFGKENYYFLNYGEGETNKEEYLRENEDLYKYIKNKSYSEIVLDSTKNPVRSFFLSKNSIVLDIFIIHLIRDARGVTWSYKKKYGKTLFYLWMWFAVNLKTLILNKKNKESYILIKYEDLVNDTESVLNEIFNKINLPHENSLKHKEGVRHHVAGNKKVYMNKEMIIKEDLSWKENLNIFEKTLGYIFNVILNIFIKILR